MSERPELPTSPAQGLATLGFLGPPPLVEGETPEAYDELVMRVTGALKPTDILEEMWVRDIVDLIWDHFRLRHLKTHLVTDCTREGVRSLLWKTKVGEPDELTRKWAAAAGVTLEGVTASVIVSRRQDFEWIERLITAAETRRNNALCQLDRHRSTPSRRHGRMPSDVEDADFQVVARSGAAQKAAGQKAAG